MALQGTLRDFSIAEIFQLIGQQQKTGVLTVTNDKQVVHVIFDQGRVVGAAEGDHGEDDRLADRLQRMGLLTEERIRDMRGSPRGSLRRIGPVLAEEGMLPKEHLIELLRLEMINIVLGLFRWESGHYEFSSREVRIEPEFAIGIQAEQVLLDGLRAKDEWPSIERSLPTLSVVAEWTEGAEIGAEEEGGGPEQTIRDLVDGERSLRAIIDESRMGEFEACRILANFKSRGYIRLATRGGPARVSARWLERYPPVALAACVAAVIGCGLLAGSLLGPAIGKIRGGELLLSGADSAAVLMENRRSRIREALEVYRIERGGYPARLEDLVSAGLLRPRDVRIPHHYEAHGDSYALL